MSMPWALRAILIRSPKALMAPWAQQDPQYCVGSSCEMVFRFFVGWLGWFLLVRLRWCYCCHTMQQKKLRVTVLLDNGSTLGINLRRKGLVGTSYCMAVGGGLALKWSWTYQTSVHHSTSHETSGLYLGWHLAPHDFTQGYKTFVWNLTGIGYNIMSIPPIMRNNNVHGFWSVSDAVYDIYDVSMALEFSNISIFQPLLLKSNIQFFKFLCVKTTSVSSHQDSWGMCWLRDMVQ